MRFLSVCSGIEAASVAWNPLGWKAVAFSEIEPFPCAVLAHHYPDTPNWGDMTKYKEWPDVPIDLLCGGTPCQSFSVAGLRKGLDDPRGNLMLTFGAIAAKYRPKWLVWENVPGVLSSNKGRDFGAFLGMLGQLGYGFAYRVLDAQFFGVPQRRRRVFVVGCLGDWRSAAAVLFERHGLSGDPAPSRQARKRIAPTLSTRAQGGGGLGTDFDCDGGLIAGTLLSGGRAAGSATQQDAHSGMLVARCLTRGSGGGQRYDAESETLIAHTLLGKHNSSHAADQDTYIAHSLRGEGFDASEDGTGRGTPLVALPFDTTQITSPENGSNPQPGDRCHPLAARAHAPAIAFDCKSSGKNGFGIGIEVAGTQRAMAHAGSHMNGGGHQAVAFAQNTRDELREMAYVGALSADPGMKQTSYIRAAMQVRRLTPEECEALQAYPRGYTRIPGWNGWRAMDANETPESCRAAGLEVRLNKKTQKWRVRDVDGPRYKALGNSWCTTNARWIGERIDRVNSILESA
ncbi:DNA cytosine methyltransferase [Achromobacter ruhlandii]|uniref:DNA cytosine methyltransferase n=1 Tax=Achromobacter ruhlandii TaxID=72557 RepID=UPI0007BFC7BC|nr:DNA cytosine methyltransferase [Achromobacter ruhlandii]